MVPHAILQEVRHAIARQSQSPYNFFYLAIVLHISRNPGFNTAWIFLVRRTQHRRTNDGNYMSTYNITVQYMYRLNGFVMIHAYREIILTAHWSAHDTPAQS